MRIHKRKLSSCQSFGFLKSDHQIVETEGTGFLARHLLLSLVLFARKGIHWDLKCLMVFDVLLHFSHTDKPLSRKAAYFKTVNHFRRRIQFSFTPVKDLSAEHEDPLINSTPSE